MEPPFDVFLSHNGKDKPIVREVWKALRDRGLRPWLDEEELLAGRDWQEALEKVIETIPAAAVCVGRDGLGPWEKREMRACLSQFVDRDQPVIPVLLPGAARKPHLPLFLQAFTWVDFRAGITTQGIEKLIAGIRGKKPALPPQLDLSPPPFHNLPFDSLENLFKGRKTELAELEAFATSSAQKKVLHGLGGIGKTRLAVEHAWRHGGRYGATFFIPADSPAGLRAQIAALAAPGLLCLPERQESAEEEVFGAVLAWLRKNPGWLLILDNVDTVAAARAVKDLLPRLQGGKVLVTSRLTAWPAGLGKREVQQISREEASAFLLERTDGQREPTSADPADAAQLAGLLDGLPLALEQAGAYIAYHRLSFRGYLEAWESTREEVLAWYDDRVMDYPRSLAVTWQQTVERLGPAPAALLRLSAYLSPEPIPIALFESGEAIVAEAVQKIGEEIGVSPETEPVRAALADLAAYSMVKLEQGSIIIHRLVQEVTRSRIPEERQQAWLALSLLLLHNRLASSDPRDVRTWSVWDPLRPHISEIVASGNATDFVRYRAPLMGQLGLFLKLKGLYPEAEKFYRHTLKMTELSTGNDDYEVAKGLNNLAMLFQETNRQGKAEKLLRRALAITKNSFGESSPQVAVSLNNLGRLLLETNRLKEAEPILTRALDLAETLLEKNDRQIASCLNNLGRLFHESNRLDDAERLFRRALKIHETSASSDATGLAIVLHNLSQLLQSKSNSTSKSPLRCDFYRDEAKSFALRSLAVLEENLGQDHPTTETARRNLESIEARKKLEDLLKRLRSTEI